MNLRSALPLLLVLLLGLTVACQRKAAKTTADMSAAAAREQLAGEAWTLSNLNGAPVAVDAGRQPPSLTFAANGRVTGFTGCNPLSGDYVLEDGLRLRLEDVAVGLSACATSATEKAFLEVVNTTDNFTISDGVLALNVGRRAPLATLTRQPAKGRRK